MTFRIFIPGTPAPQGSKRHVGKGIMVESSTRVAPWRDLIVTMCHDRLSAGTPTIEGPVAVSLDFWFPRPQGHYRTGRHAGELRQAAIPLYPRGGGDADKLARAVLDAIGRKYGAGVIADDADVIDLYARKRYASHHHVGCDITVTGALA